MKRTERGIALDLILYGVAAIALLGVLWGAIHAVTSYLSDITEEAHKAGEAACDTAYKARDNKQLADALARVQTLEEQARKAEREHSLALGQIDLKLKKEHENGQAAEKRVLADIAAGRLVVRGSAFQARECPAVSDRGIGTASSAAASGSDASPRCELSAETAQLVLDIGREADGIVAQLAAAQQVIIEDRRICGTL